jgi:hypothetical protein
MSSIFRVLASIEATIEIEVEATDEDALDAAVASLSEDELLAGMVDGFTVTVADVQSLDDVAQARNDALHDAMNRPRVWLGSGRRFFGDQYAAGGTLYAPADTEQALFAEAKHRLQGVGQSSPRLAAAELPAD